MWNEDGSKTRLWTSLLSLAFFLHHLRSTVAGGSPPPYVPDETILLDCGSSEDSSDVDDRVWIGDVNSIFFRPEQSQNQATATAFTDSHNSAAAKAPFKSGRISFSAFTYTFPLSAGAKFIRLYFLSSGYSGFPPSNAIFSVKAGPFILLSDFRPSNFSAEYNITREYCVTLKETQTLSITCAPSANNSYAFISGIEIVSMPPYLYYTPPDHEGLSLIGQQKPYRIADEMALETVYRVNVGILPISPREDTGMFRRWSEDRGYRVYSDSIVEPGSVEVDFSKMPAFIAPEMVYLSARDVLLNSRKNLTFNFPVHNAFVYLVRLHFCNFAPDYEGTGEKVFRVFIADQITENAVDEIKWSSISNVPVYKDYAVPIFDGEGEKIINLSVKLHGMLNGVEVFRTSRLEGNLSKPSPRPIRRKPNHNGTTIATAIGGGIFGYAVVFFLWLLTFRQGKRAEKPCPQINSTKTHISSPRSRLCSHFSLTTIKAATNNFDQALVIGVGGFGNVYKGFIDGGSDPVAIKRLMPDSQQGAHEFETEIEMLSRLRHRHLVSLIGYCDEGNEMILVYDYMARGALRDYLCNNDHPSLTWKQRLEICIGAAHGLNYLHSGAQHTIIHRDVKTTNILLDKDWVAKVSDFGLSKVGPSGPINAHVSTMVKGTFGYLDPEYFRYQKLTQKSDVYSFGVILCEVLCGKPPIIHTTETQVVGLVEWVREYYHNRMIDQIVDPSLSGEIMPECLMKFVEIVVNCLHDSGTKRPSMNDVVRDLEFALQLQESPNQDLRLNKEVTLTISMSDENSGICSPSRGEEFSEITNPRGR